MKKIIVNINTLNSKLDDRYPVVEFINAAKNNFSIFFVSDDNQDISNISIPLELGCELDIRHWDEFKGDSEIALIITDTKPPRTMPPIYYDAIFHSSDGHINMPDGFYCFLEKYESDSFINFDKVIGLLHDGLVIQNNKRSETLSRILRDPEKSLEKALSHSAVSNLATQFEERSTGKPWEFNRDRVNMLLRDIFYWTVIYDEEDRKPMIDELIEEAKNKKIPINDVKSVISQVEEEAMNAPRNDMLN